jgi:cytochrome b involved in lipid metabolism
LAWASLDHILLDSEKPNQKTIEEEDEDDPDRAPKGAKGSKHIERSTGPRTTRLGTSDSGDTSTNKGKRYITMEEVAAHNLSNDAWVVVEGNVWE